jgi:hypothetical protein
MCSEIYKKNIIMMTLEKVPKDAHKAVEEHQRVAKEHWKAARQMSFKSSLHASRKIDKAWSLKSNKSLLPPINDTIEITPNVSTSSPRLLMRMFPVCLLITIKI